jgi:hypothetical protein
MGSRLEFEKSLFLKYISANFSALKRTRHERRVTLNVVLLHDYTESRESLHGNRGWINRDLSGAILVPD